MPSITIRGNGVNSAGIFNSAIFSWSIFNVARPNELPVIKGNSKSITVRM